MSREVLLTDAQWAAIEPLLPPQRPARGRPMRDHRQVIEGIFYPCRTGVAWRDLPRCFGPWQTVWKRHRRIASGGTWDRILGHLLALAEARGEVDWSVSVDSTINRAHQHATNLPRRAELLIEPADHGIGRSRGGLSSKIHQLVDGGGRPLVVLVAAGHGGDSPMLRTLLAHLRVAHPGAPARTRPDAVLGDKAYSSRANRPCCANARSRP